MRVERDDFFDALKRVTPFRSRGGIEPLKKVLLEDNTVTCFDGSAGCSASFDAEELSGIGEAYMVSDVVTQAVQTMSGELFVGEANGMLDIKGGKATLQIPFEDGENYPTIPRLEFPRVEACVGDLEEIVKRVVPAAESRDKEGGVTNCIQLTYDGSGIQATCGTRTSALRLKVQALEGTEEWSTMIRAKDFVRMVKAMDTKGSVKIGPVNDYRSVCMASDTTTAWCLVPSGGFPDWETIMADVEAKVSAELSVNSDALLENVNRARALSGQENQPVDIKVIDGERLQISTASISGGTVLGVATQEMGLEVEIDLMTAVDFRVSGDHMSTMIAACGPGLKIRYTTAESGMIIEGECANGLLSPMRKV